MKGAIGACFLSPSGLLLPRASLDATRVTSLALLESATT